MIPRLPILVGLAGCGVVPRAAESEPPAPSTDTELRASCDAVNFDLDDCHELARRRLARGEVAEAVDPLAFACTKYGTACVELGTLYLQGAPGVSQDIEKGFEFTGKGCSGFHGDANACAWDVLRQLTRDDARPRWRNTIELGADISCRHKQGSDWGCFNYGVGLACGLFVEPDLTYARHVLDRGCRLGDSRACKLSIQLRDYPEEPVSCDLIGPDPEVSVQLPLHLEPLPSGTVLPPEREQAKRTPMP